MRWLDQDVTHRALRKWEMAPEGARHRFRDKMEIGDLRALTLRGSADGSGDWSLNWRNCCGFFPPALQR